MLRTMGLVFIMLVAGLSLRAQETPKVEVFGGYTLVSVDDHAPAYIPQRYIHNGWTSSVNFNFSRNVGFISDFGGYYGTHDPFPGTTIPSSIHSFLFGPQLSEQLKSFSPFGHFLIGAAIVHDKANFNPSLVRQVDAGLPTSETGFAFDFGGGFDTRISDRMAWRVEIDYLNTSFFEHKWDNGRFATGVVFHFGSR